jgi:GNAT superfamily N-acetyltransferase
MTSGETSPPPQLETVVTYLELGERPGITARDLPPGLAIEHVEQPAVSLYRDVFRRVGDPWLWFERKTLDDDALRRIIEHPDVEVHLLLEGRRAVGLAELDFCRPPDAELAYFGIEPRLLGQGVGGAFFDRVVELAWSRPIARFWLHTCTLDHPRALDFYRGKGMTVFKSVEQTVVDPRTQPFWDS